MPKIALSEPIAPNRVTAGGVLPNAAETRSESVTADASSAAGTAPIPSVRRYGVALVIKLRALNGALHRPVERAGRQWAGPAARMAV